MDKKALLLAIIIYGIVIVVMIFIKFSVKTEYVDFINFGIYTEKEGSIARIPYEEKEGSMRIEIPSYGDVPIRINEEKSGFIEEKTKRFEEEKKEKGFESANGYSISGEISMRKLIRFRMPEFPKDEKEPSQVKLEITVDELGNVVKIDIVKTGGYNFDKSAIDAVKEWVFIPLKDVKEQKGIVTIYFKLK
uniref:TonB family protein n=1 Tax=candidate division WOR-3 bacterium TaxID=2052148 RepID=A0A7C4Y4A9_UNCW3